jgi:hypothetical protein
LTKEPPSRRDASVSSGLCYNIAMSGNTNLGSSRSGPSRSA